MVFSQSNLGHVPLVPAVSPIGCPGTSVQSLRDRAGACAREGEYVFRSPESGLLGQRNHQAPADPSFFEDRYRKVKGA